MAIKGNPIAHPLAPDRKPSAFLDGGGELGACIRAFDWTTSPLGAPPTWPQNLKTCVRIMLTARQPMSVWWGEAMTVLYNDAYRAMIGAKHPAALGKPAAQVWPEIWAEAGPRAHSALYRAEGTYDEALQLLMGRNGYPEETYYTCSYTPIPNDDGTTGGILCAHTDDTRRIVGERRLTLLRDLATRTWDANSVQDSLVLSAECLRNNPQDIPFALIYVLDVEKRTATLAARCGISADHTAARGTANLDDTEFWPLEVALARSAPLLWGDLGTRFGGLPGGAWELAPEQAAILPIVAQGHSGVLAVLVAGCNPHCPYDEPYQEFLMLVAKQISATIANTYAYEKEVKRAQTLLELDRTRNAFSAALRRHANTLETLNRVGQVISSDLDLGRVAQSAIDAATQLCGAEFGAFFYSTSSGHSDTETGCALSNISATALSRMLEQRDFAIFETVPEREGPLRSDDITRDPRFGPVTNQLRPYPNDMMPVRSYLAVPVISRLGELIGNMYFGHGSESIFTENAERLISGIASQTATAIDNARLFHSAQGELARRHEIEKHQRSLLDELNHRVNNTLATVQAIAMQTLRGADNTQRDTFLARLFALSAQHELLTRDNWGGVNLRDVVQSALRPVIDLCTIEGPDVLLAPKRALALGMAFHELVRNASQHGALSTGAGAILVSWQVDSDGRLCLRWKETGGPLVQAPARKGFGRRLIETGLAHEISASVRLEFPSEGVTCEWDIPSPPG